MRWVRAIAMVVAALIVLSSFDGVQVMARVAARSSPPVFVDVAGRCPLNPVNERPFFCRHTVYGNISAGDFPLPFRPWGIAYAFNCGTKAGSFRAAVGIVQLDGYFPETNFSRSGKSLRGYYMETDRANESWRHIIPDYRAVENIEAGTTCTFHLRAVFGSARVVARFVPAIPQDYPMR